ncbi:MAG: hypothetical protein IPM92_17465 [Saprospiraceae bacterium]|nr:hypothetical protein [Saprospiraceae bacterium]
MTYSRVFDPKTDRLISSGTQDNPCVTNFYKAPIASFIESNQQSAYFEVDSVLISGEVHFRLKAIPINGQSTPIYVGELPCPDHSSPRAALLSLINLKELIFWRYC